LRWLPGASKGIGAGIAKALAEQGAAVVVNFTLPAKKVRIASFQRSQGRAAKAFAVKGDIAKTAEVKELFRKTIEAFGVPRFRCLRMAHW
jgi:3-oxoacyl-[acyl-carrier protein] reductase